VLQRISDSLSKLCCLQWNCDSLLKLNCLNRISIPCQTVFFAANLWFVAEVVLLAENCDSLPKLSCLSQIRFHCQKWVLQWICDSLLNSSCFGELAFAVESVLPTMNQRSLLKVYWLQRSSIHCRNWSACSESVFAAKLCGLQRISFHYRIVLIRCQTMWLAVKQIHYQIVRSVANHFSLPIFYKRIHDQKWLKWL